MNEKARDFLMALFICGYPSFLLESKHLLDYGGKVRHTPALAHTAQGAANKVSGSAVGGLAGSRGSGAGIQHPAGLVMELEISRREPFGQAAGG